MDGSALVIHADHLTVLAVTGLVLVATVAAGIIGRTQSRDRRRQIGTCRHCAATLTPPVDEGPPPTDTEPPDGGLSTTDAASPRPTLRDWRVGQGLTQREVGERVGVSRTEVSRWERLSHVPPARRERVAAVLGIPAGSERWPAVPEPPDTTLRDWRVGQGLTQREVGERVGVGRPEVSRWERFGHQIR